LEHNGHLRLFVAVPLPDELKARVGRFVERIRSRAVFKRWVHPADLHLTLKYIGEVHPSAMPAIEEALERTASRSHAVSLRLDGFGTFGSPHSPRVLWAGVQGNLERLHSLHAGVEQELNAIGYPREVRPYSPHITLARRYVSGSPPAPDELLQTGPADNHQALAWEADCIVLYSSRLGRSPMYEPLRTFPLSGSGSV